MMEMPPYAALVSEAVLYLCVIGMGYVLFLIRQRLRGFAARVAPAGALTTAGGPPRGASLGTLTVRTLDGQMRALSDFGDPLLLMFVADACPISRKLIPVARDVARVEGLKLVFAGEEEAGRQTRFAARIGQAPSAFINDPDAGRVLGVDKLPYAFFLDADSRLVASGLVNSREHLESLVISGELDIASVQSYLATHSHRSVA
ncbi:thioredoxin domain-containing protein [Acetobacter oeni]|uniref:Thioredoxin domain-containing protein n=1 Tax=Acetobacter oeni TaxID=304077 RepID=A0A511XM64_9PROT|nr:methylamine utilization protein MauD [Acetobacter oeni]MBB3884045.1 methylamine dehydrogenase accessory protein MauD [Acetobacter oeni]NHO20010.1 methylamine utilization protein MauD [Acetobacter oeni]GBR08474.1 hypothetical protein AA21952_2629 [Acetobacter oeni LMG 21952]GEN64032.1 hypothetical protein AOE01nite_22560 [Acetobacter oeni]